jgi:enoyl-CoA hydratase
MTTKEMPPKTSAKYALEKPLDETVLYEKLTKDIVAITLNRPEKHNALFPPDMFNEVSRKIAMAVDDDDIKVIILKGNGKSFCSGDDLNLAPYDTYGGAVGVKPSQRVRVKAVLTWLNGMYRSILYCPKTIICQAHGWTIGVGLAMLMCCDIAIVSESALFSQRQQRTGFGGISMGWQFIQMFTVGYKRMREWQLTGRALTAQEAKEWAVVNSIVPDDKLEAETMRWAKAVALNPADSLMIGKTHTHMMFDLLGMQGQFSAGALAYPLFTNLKWEDEEFNFLKRRGEVGVTKAFAEREARWAELGF